MKTPMTATRVAKMKDEAKRLARTKSITHSEALEQLARGAGYASWHEASSAAAQAPAAEPPITQEGGRSSIRVPGELPGHALVISVDGDGDEAKAALRAYVRERSENEARQKAAQEEGVPALKRLYKIAIGHSGQCRHVAAFLLGLYNGARFPFDLTDLRCVDRAIFDDCMRVLRMDSSPQQEVHRYFEDGGAKFEELAKRWAVADVRRLRIICDQIRERGLRSFDGEDKLIKEIEHALASTWPDED